MCKPDWPSNGITAVKSQQEKTSRNAKQRGGGIKIRQQKKGLEGPARKCNL